MSAVPTEFTADIPDRRDPGRGPTGDPASGRVRMPVPVPATVPVPPPASPVAGPPERRVVAVAFSAEELLRPESDLARILRAAPTADLLVATDGPRLTPVRIPVPPPVHVDDLPPVELDQHAVAEQELEIPTSVVIDDLDVPGLRVHRLDLPVPLPAGAEDDLVAALSELVGFDPEPGVVCLAPAPGGGVSANVSANVSAADSAADSAVIGRAAQRVAQVYGLPLLRFRSRDLCAAAAVTG